MAVEVKQLSFLEVECSRAVGIIPKGWSPIADLCRATDFTWLLQQLACVQRSARHHRSRAKFMNLLMPNSHSRSTIDAEVVTLHGWTHRTNWRCPRVDSRRSPRNWRLQIKNQIGSEATPIREIRFAWKLRFESQKSIFSAGRIGQIRWKLNGSLTCQSNLKWIFRLFNFDLLEL